MSDKELKLLDRYISIMGADYAKAICYGSKDVIDVALRKSAESSGIYEYVNKLIAENKTWQEMVDSVNQTNNAMGKKLKAQQSRIEELEGALSRIDDINAARTAVDLYLSQPPKSEE